MLQEMVLDTFYMYVMNDRQVKNLIELSETNIVCLCVLNQCHKKIGTDYNEDLFDDGTSFSDEILMKG